VLPSQLEKQLLLPRHALQSANLPIAGEHERTSSLPVNLAVFRK
jgi:hypothetical protein